MYIRVTLIFFLAFLTADSYAQFWKKKKKRAETENAVQQPNSLDPSAEEPRAYVPKASRKASRGPTYGLEQEFYDRMEELAKVRKKNERLMQKPQYSNPLYFGHKRPPKKRKPSKMKFCKECGIRH
jgi:hypothetical protein